MERGFGELLEKGLKSQRTFTSCLSSSDETSKTIKSLTSRDRKNNGLG